MQIIAQWFNDFIALMSTFRFNDLIDILLISLLIYSVLKLIRDTRAEQLLKGLLFIFVIYVFAMIFDLMMVTTIIKVVFESAVVLIVIVFQPEIRKALEQLGRSKFAKTYKMIFQGGLITDAEREDIQQASERKRQSILRVELEWVKRGARARSTKQKARLERYEDMKNMEAPVRDGQVELGSVSTRMGRSTIELAGISKAYDGNVLIRDFSYIFLKNDRIGFLGPNGAGKSTLLKMIMGLIEPDQGTIDIGPTVKIGYYAQEIGDEEMRPDVRVIDYIKDVAEYVQTEDGVVTAAKMLENFLFNGEMQYSRLEKLSGGERRRLYLCKVLMSAPNVLILDEPTNDLDISTLQILEDYLDRFQGIVIVVSHDRYFLDRVVRRIFSFEEGGELRQHEGGYTDYALRKAAENAVLTGSSTMQGSKAGTAQAGAGTQGAKNGEKAAASSDSAKKWNADRARKLKFTYQEAKDYETIESDIANLEEKIEKLESDMLSCATDFVKLKEITEAKEAAELLLEEKMERWMYLEDLAKRIAEQ